MQLSAFRSAIETRTGVSSSDGSITTAVKTEFVNSALRRVQNEKDWYWLEDTETVAFVNADDAYTVSGVRTIAVVDASGNELENEPFLKVLRNVGSAAVPVMYARYGDTIKVRPTPNTSGNLTHYFVNAETALSADSDTPLMPSAFDDAVIEYACYLVNLRLGRPDAAAANLAAYNGWIEQMKARADRYADTRGGGATA